MKNGIKTEDIELSVRFNFLKMWDTLSLLEKRAIVAREILDGVMTTDELVELVKEPTRKLGRKYFETTPEVMSQGTKELGRAEDEAKVVEIGEYIRKRSLYNKEINEVLVEVARTAARMMCEWKGKSVTDKSANWLSKNAADYAVMDSITEEFSMSDNFIDDYKKEMEA